MTLVLLLMAAPVVAATTSKWLGGPSTPSTAGVRYVSIQGGGAVQSSGNEIRVQGVVPVAGTLSKLYAWASVAPSGASTWTVTVRQNAADTTLTCQITSSGASCNDLGHTVSYAAGDLIDVGITPGTSPTAANLSWVAEFSGAATVWMGNTNATSLSTTSTQYMAGMGVANVNITEAVAQNVVPLAGTVAGLYVNLPTAAGVGITRTFTLSVNGTPDATCAVAFANTSGTASDTCTAAISAGDTITIQSSIAGGTAAASTVQYGIAFTPTTINQFALMTTGGANASTSVTNYHSMAGSDSPDATEANVQEIGYSDFFLSASYCVVSSAPGGAASYTMNLRQGAADASTPFTVAISGAATSGSASGSFTPSALGLLDYAIVPASTPAAVRVNCSYQGSIPTGSAITGLLLLGVGGW